MQNTQEIATVSIQIQLNKVAHEAKKIPQDLYSRANKVLHERLYKLQNENTEGLNEIA